MNIAELLAAARIVKNETGKTKNTHTRIGLMFENILNYIQELPTGGSGSGGGSEIPTSPDIIYGTYVNYNTFTVDGIAVVLDESKTYIDAELNALYIYSDGYLQNIVEKFTNTLYLSAWGETEPTPAKNKWWYNPTVKELNVCVYIGGTMATYIWVPAPMLVKNIIYIYEYNSYVWNGSDMIPSSADFNAANLVTISKTPKIYTLGDNAFGGIIAYILQAGDPGFDANIQKGLVAYPTDLVASRWSNVIDVIPVLSDVIGAGKANSDTIISLSAYQEGLPDGTNYAAKLCEALGEGWFLPSLNELKKFKANKVAIGGFQTEIVGGNADTVTYWSSSYNDGKKAILFDNTNTEISSWANNLYLVRPCKYFTNEIQPITKGEIIVSAGGKEVEGSGKTLENYVEKDGAKVLSDNNFTNILKEAYDSAYTAKHTHTADFLQIVNTIPLICSDKTSDIVASTTVSKNRYVFQTAQSFTKIVGELDLAAVGGTFTVDVKKTTGGVTTSVFSTLLTFNSGEKTTRTATVPFVLATSPISFAVGDAVEVFVTNHGSVTAGKGLTVYMM